MSRSRGDGRLAVILLLGAGLAVTWAGAVLFDLQLRPMAGPWPRVALPPLPDAGVLPDQARTLSAEAVRLGTLEPLAGQALLAIGLAAAAALLQLTLTLWARASTRTHDMAVRRVLGPTTARLLAPLLRGAARTLLRGLVAGALMAAVLLAGAWISAPGGVHPLASIDLAIAVPATLLLLGAVLLFGLLPAAVSPTRALTALRAGDRVTSRGAGGAIVTTHVALALALLYSGAIQYRQHTTTLANEAAVPLVRIDFRDVDADASVPAPRLAAALGGEMASPGAALGLAPVAGVLAECPGCAMGGLSTPLRSLDSMVAHVTAGFLPTLGVPVVDGRGLRPDDGPDVVLVNEAFVRTGVLGPGSGVGRTVRLATEPLHARTVVGVAGDIPTAGAMIHTARPTVYMPWPDRPAAAVDVVFPDDDTASSLDALPTLVPGAYPGAVTTVAAERDRAEAIAAWLARLVAALGFVAFAVAAAGTVQATATAVRLRRRELGVRLALGATPPRLVGTVAGQTARYVVRGALVSPVLIAVTTPHLDWNAGLFAWILALITALALAGAVLPARAAALVPPDTSLRDR